MSVKCGNRVHAETTYHATAGQVRDCFRGVTQTREGKHTAPRPTRWYEVPAAPKPAQPAYEPAPMLADGRYAIDFDGQLRFFKLKTVARHNGNGTFTFVDEQAGPSWYPVKPWSRALRVLMAINLAGAHAALVRYGRELGECGVCGRELTDETSRANGIGPICAGKTGW